MKSQNISTPTPTDYFWPLSWCVQIQCYIILVASCLYTSRTWVSLDSEGGGVYFVNHAMKIKLKYYVYPSIQLYEINE